MDKRSSLVAPGIALIATAIGIVLWFMPAPEGAPPEMMRVAAVVLVAISLWATSVLPEYFTAIILFFLAMVLTDSGAPTVFSGFHSAAVWMIFGGLIIGASVQETGFGKTLASGLLRFFPRSYFGILAGITVVGAVLGIGLVRGGRSIRWRVLGGIGVGWLMTPVIACLICFVGLFFLQNVFNQRVHHFTPYVVTAQVLDRLAREGIATAPLRPFAGELFATEHLFRAALAAPRDLTDDERDRIVTLAQRGELFIDPQRFAKLDQGWLTTEQLLAMQRLAGQRYPHRWLLAEALARLSPEWRMLPESAATKQGNDELKRKLGWLHQLFAVQR